MDRWQLHYKDAVSFICIGCAGPGLAVQFSKRLRLRHCTVSYAVDNPRWGQLGCNGFIILDAEHNVVSTATSAFLEVRDLAFRHVETVLEAVLAGRPPPRVCPGMKVVLNGLSDATMNGKSALCVAAPEGAQSRCTVKLSSSGRKLSVKSKNLSVNGEEYDPEADFDRETGGCGAGGCAPEAKKQKQKQKQPTASCGAEGGCALPARRASSEKVARGSAGGDASVVVAPLSPIDSVHVDVLDEEHELCAAALEAFALHRTRAALQCVLDAYRSHFAHEESLLDKHVYGGEDLSGSAGGFSAALGQRKSHYGDHTRMINAIVAQLGMMTSSDSQVVGDALFVNRVLRDFETHAGTYDETYVGEMAKEAGS